MGCAENTWEFCDRVTTDGATVGGSSDGVVRENFLEDTT